MPAGVNHYTGRFAPSPTGPLHAGSLTAALASWLDARANAGQWFLRIEDVDTPRCVPGADTLIIQQLTQCGLIPDAPPLWQSQRGPHYAQALNALGAAGWVYPCGCTRKQIDAALAVQGHAHQRHVERVYPGTCRQGLHGRPARAWRLLSTADLAATQGLQIDWIDRRLGAQQQDLTREVGDFVLKRADGLWAYQLAVVVDDAAQGITHIVRGADLADNTARQLRLQALLGLPTPRYLHTPLVLDARGEKLSKQHGAPALDLAEPVQALRAAASALGLDVQAPERGAFLARATEQWRARWPLVA